VILSVVIALGFAWLLGTLAASACWSRQRPAPADLLLLVPLGLGLGLGLTSIFFFAASLIANEPRGLAAGMDGLAIAGLSWCLWRKPPAAAAKPRPPARTGLLVTALVGSILGQAAVVAVVVSARAYEAEPLGSWDGWAIWNMHARFLFHAGPHWADALRQPTLNWTHPDYPLLVPASVARAWAWVGRDAPLASGLVSGAFGAATAGLLMAATARLRPALVAFTGGLVLLGTPFFVTFASNEHADIPLGFFILATLTLLALSQRGGHPAGALALAGLTAGLAAWTKNEGLLFAMVVSFALVARELVRGSPRLAGAFLGGLLAGLLPVIYFKVMLAPPGDLVSGGITARLGQLLDASRHRLILASLWRDAMRFGEWCFAPFLVMLLPLAGPGWRRFVGREWSAAAAVALTAAGYYTVYLLTPLDLKWHVDNSMVRLLIQLWPATIFLWCLALSAEESSASSGRTLRRPGVVLAGFVLLNLAGTGVLLSLFARQLAPNEMARARTGGREFSAVLGEGWFAREGRGSDLWVWSRGESRLLLRADGSPAAGPFTVAFGLRSLDARQVTAKIGDRIVWSGVAGPMLSQVRIPGLQLSSGDMTLVFTTDRPGVPESGATGARALTFALYHPRIE